MKKLLFVILNLFLVASIFLTISFRKVTVLPSVNNNMKNGIAVVELFTSEGCSSCPPADEVAAAIQKEFPDNVFVLGFHVDYWDYIGWKDEYSNAAFTKRQQDYAEHFALRSIYTPEIVLNGEKEFVGSNSNKLHNEVEAALNNSLKETIVLSTSETENNTITVNYIYSNKEKAIINFALVQLTATSNVKRGENSGRKLHHINVVRDFKTVEVVSGKINLTIPAGLSTKDVKIIAYAQEKSSLKVVAAAALSF
ncbi:MAG: DUF1223 domain-containing protein [Sphingobacteriales bacterium]